MEAGVKYDHAVKRSPSRVKPQLFLVIIWGGGPNQRRKTL